jgi:monothiol glutaredoxin
MNERDKGMNTMTDELRNRIEKTIGQQRIMLFMKGSPAMPQCGFSAAVVQILKQLDVPFGSHNILADSELREGLKQYSNWPTYPQLYLDGKLVGGSDIIRELHTRGELGPLLGSSHVAV